LEKSIYIVEDNEDIRELIEYLLAGEGFLVTAFPNATSFNQQIKGKNPNVIILDVMLPDGNGIEICSQLKGSAETKDIPVLLMSANTNITYHGQKSEADDFISKPFDIDDLVERVKVLLSKMAN
jgi:DNA-binding response OmpR family regulator